MSIGTILLIILVIALLGGFSVAAHATVAARTWATRLALS